MKTSELTYQHSNLILRQHKAGIGIWNLKLGVWHTLPMEQSVVDAHARLTDIRRSLSAGQKQAFNLATDRQIKRSCKWWNR